MLSKTFQHNAADSSNSKFPESNETYASLMWGQSVIPAAKFLTFP
jgi:hypothetical protein